MGFLVQPLCRVRLFSTPWTAEHQASPPFTISQTLLKLMSTELVMPSNHLVLFSCCLQSFPASGSFLVSWLFASGGQSIGDSASASVLPMNIQDWFPLGWTGLILQSKRLSRVFNTTVQKHQFCGAQPSLGFPGDSEGKPSACNAGDLGLIPKSGRSSGEGNDNPLHYSCLRGAW